MIYYNDHSKNPIGSNNVLFNRNVESLMLKNYFKYYY